MSTVLITGANRGLGFEFAKQYVADGWRVLATCRDPAKADALGALGPSVSLFRLDVADLDAIAALGRTVHEPIDVLIANAGVFLARGVRPDQISAADWDRSFRINSAAPVALATSFHAQVAKSRERKMIAISSRLASNEFNNGGDYCYRASKAALNSAWRALAADFQDVIVTLMSPGYVRTDMGGPAAPLTPEQSIASVRRLIAGLSASDSGRFLSLDGKSLPW